jgi:hypothetical protein
VRHPSKSTHKLIATWNTRPEVLCDDIDCPFDAAAKCLKAHTHKIEEDNRLLKDALGHANAALDGWGDKGLVEALETIKHCGDEWICQDIAVKALAKYKKK